MLLARLFVPGQTTLTLTQPGQVPLACFPRTAAGQPDYTRLATADEVGVAQALGCPREQVSLLYQDATTLVYGTAPSPAGAARPDNPAAEVAVYGACGELSELAGPILLLTPPRPGC